MPETVPEPLRWSSKDRYPIQDVPEKETDWRVLTAEELNKVVVTPIDDACVPAVGSVPLKQTSSIKPQKGRVKMKKLDPPMKKPGRNSAAGLKASQFPKCGKQPSTFPCDIDVAVSKTPGEQHHICTTKDIVSMSVVRKDPAKNNRDDADINDCTRCMIHETDEQTFAKAVRNCKKRARQTPEPSTAIALPDSPVSTRKRPRVQLSSVPTKEGPLGLIWDSMNYSSAYDSLFTVLFAAYNVDAVWWNTVVANQNRYIRSLTRHFESINNNRITFEFARDELRAELYHTDPMQFPYSGRVGTDIYELCRYILGVEKSSSWYV